MTQFYFPPTNNENHQSYMKSLLLHLGVVALCLFSRLDSASAAAKLDQYYEPDEIMIASPVVYEHALTYPVGTSGRLTQVDLLLGRNTSPIVETSENIILDIRRTDGFAPLDDDSTIFARTTVVAQEVLTTIFPGFQWVSFDLTPFQLNVSSNDVLAISLHSDYGLFSNSNVLWGGSADDGVTGLESFSRFQNSTTWYVNHALKGTHDSFDMPIFLDSGPIHYGFRTYVESVPEPSTGALMIGGICGMLVYFTRKNKLLLLGSVIGYWGQSALSH
jgi:hypothetical protein